MKSWTVVNDSKAVFSGDLIEISVQRAPEGHSIEWKMDCRALSINGRTLGVDRTETVKTAALAAEDIVRTRIAALKYEME